MPLPPPRKSRIGLQELGQDILPRDQQTPEVLAAFQKDEIEKWWPIIAAAGGSLSDIETTMAMTAKDASARSNLPEGHEGFPQCRPLVIQCAKFRLTLLL